MKNPLTKMLKADALALADEVAQLRKKIEVYQERERRIALIADEFDRLGTEWYFSPQLSERYSDAAAKIREVLNNVIIK